jgi:putative restriction endonuclease
MQDRILGIRERIRYDATTGSDNIGCIQLVSPVFFPRELWIPQPADWHPRTQTPVKYDLTIGEGRRVWKACVDSASQTPVTTRSCGTNGVIVQDEPRYGAPLVMTPRLGQNTFRIAVLDAYERACSVTSEHSLPALEAGHIRSYANDGPHEVRNGLLLRADLHRLFDKGYVTVASDLRFVVGERLRADFKNGRSYYPLHGASLRLPPTGQRPAEEFLVWHNDNVFRG